MMAGGADMIMNVALDQATQMKAGRMEQVAILGAGSDSGQAAVAAKALEEGGLERSEVVRHDPASEGGPPVRFESAGQLPEE